MSKLKKDHVLASGGGALAAGAAGAAVGALVAGPPGAVVGAAAAGALGAIGGHKAGEAMDGRGDLGRFQQIYQTMPYFRTEMRWEDYAPAYSYAITRFNDNGGVPASPLSADDWQRVRGTSRLSLDEARPAVEHAWRDLEGSTPDGGT